MRLPSTIPELATLHDSISDKLTEIFEAEWEPRFQKATTMEEMKVIHKELRFSYSHEFACAPIDASIALEYQSFQMRNNNNEK